MLIAFPVFAPSCELFFASPVARDHFAAISFAALPRSGMAVETRCADDSDDDDEDLGDEEDLSTPDPDVDEESSFDDFDDEFDDDFEEEENEEKGAARGEAPAGAAPTSTISSLS